MCCRVQLPPIEIDPETFEMPYEKVYEYFDFELRTYAPTAETNAVR